MSMLICTVDLPDNAAIRFEQDNNVTYWAGFGEPTFQGTREEFAARHPAVVHQLARLGVVRPEEK